MYTRISSTIALLTLAACGGHGTTNETLAKVEATAAAQAEENGRVLCAQGGAELARTCTVDREEGGRGLILTLRHPDGAFRRLLVTRDGRGVAAADGAEPARVRVVDASRIDVTIGDMRYELPATVKSGGKR